MVLSSSVGKAMAVQVNRTRREPTLQDIIDELRVKLAQAERERDTAQAEVKRLNEENDQLALKAHRARKTSADGSTSGKFHDGVEYVNQTEAAAILNVPQFKMSRWVKANKFEMIAVPGFKIKQIVRASLYKPNPAKLAVRRNNTVRSSI